MSNKTNQKETKEELEQEFVATEQVVEEVTAQQEETTEEVVVDEKEQKIAELTAKLAEEENRYLRLRADYDNTLRFFFKCLST